VGETVLEAGFIPDARTIYLDQPMFITFTVKTRTASFFSFDVGGDYRGSPRANSFRITAVGADGKEVRDPTGYNHFGGMVQTRSVSIEKIYAERLFLPLWCAFEKPGDYTVTCRRTLGTFREPRPPKAMIESVFTLKVVPFDAVKQRVLIAELGRKVREGKESELPEATRALAFIRDEQVIPHLVASLTKGDYRTHALAIDGLKNFTTDAAVDGLVFALNNRDHYVAGRAAEALQVLGGITRAVDTLLPKLADKNPMVRAQAARALGWTKSPRASGPLAKLLTDTECSGKDNEPGAYSAARALGQLLDPRADEMLRTCMNSPDYRLRVAAAQGMELARRPIEPEWLTPILRERDARQREFHEAIRLLRLYGGPKAARAMVECIDFDNPHTNSPRTMWLLLGAEYATGGPKYYYKWKSDPNRTGSEEEMASNRQVLAELKAWLKEQNSK
jgi:HEAT repeat protein